MRGVEINELYNEIEFVKRASKSFASNPAFHIYTDGEIEPGCLFALRYGLDKDCIVVFRIDECCEVKNYYHSIPWSKP